MMMCVWVCLRCSFNACAIGLGLFYMRACLFVCICAFAAVIGVVACYPFCYVTVPFIMWGGSGGALCCGDVRAYV